MEITVLEGQSLIDMAIQEYGSIDALFQLAEDNNISNITSELQAGQKLSVFQEKIVSKQVVEYLKKIKVNPSTAPRTGVGYSAIGVDFIIS